MSNDYLVISPEELASGRVLPPGMVEDLCIVASLEHGLVQQLADALREEPGILTEEQVRSFAERYLENDDTAAALARTIQSIYPSTKQQVLAVVDKWRRIATEGVELMPDSAFASLRANIGVLIQDFPGLALMRKAQRLLRDTGNEFVGALFVCDLRPIFDKPRERVEGFVALANLRLRYVRQNGDHDSFEMALSEEELELLVEEGQKAIGKLRVLRETVPNLFQLRELSDSE